jgi:adenylate kinase family enzyme/nucleoside diphosphate kinase
VHCSSSLEAAEKELKLFFPEGALQLQRTLCVVKPATMPSVLQVRMMIEDAGFTILTEKQVVVTESRAKEFYRERKDEPSFDSTVAELCAGPCCVMVLCRMEAVSVFQQLAQKYLRIRSVHGSATVKAAAREVRFFFPELPSDPIPGNEEVNDFLFRKSATASMDLKSVPESSRATDFAVDPTLQQLLSKGLMSLCQVQPKGLAAVKWLSRWLDENNPNKPAAEADAPKFAPPQRTKQFVEYGVNDEGMPFAVELPPTTVPKPVVEVDVSGEAPTYRNTKLTSPFVVFVLGGPGSGKGTHCAKLRDEFNLIHLSTGDLMREEVAAKSHLGTEIYRHMQTGSLVPDEITVRLLKNAMLKHRDTNRFLIDGFPRTLEQAKMFEHEIATVSFAVSMDLSPDVMRQRIAARAAAAPGRVDDNPETVEKRLKVFEEQSKPVIDFYEPIGKLRRVSSEAGIDEVYAEVRRHFCSNFVYLLGPPGAPVVPVAKRLEETYGHCCVNVPALLQAYGDSKEEDAPTVKRCLATGKPVDPAIVCPLVLKEIVKGRSVGQSNFVLCDFPQTLKQAQFLELRMPCTSKPLLLDFGRADAEDVAAMTMPIECNELEVETRIARFFGPEMQGTLRSLPRLERIPLSFAGKEPLPAGEASLDAAGVEQHLVDSACAAVFEKIRPGLTVVLGLPCSGAKALAQMLAKRTPGSLAVDCNELIAAEIERKTDVGLMIEEALKGGQALPPALTSELLKKIAALTCSDALVVENCPIFVDQIDGLAKEFRIDRAFYVAGDSGAQGAWKAEFDAAMATRSAGSELAKSFAAKAFEERLQGLEPIAAHFSRLGKLERLNVSKTPTSEELAGLIESATMPQFAIVTGSSTVITPKQAEKLATAYSELPVTAEKVVAWAKATLSETIDPAQPDSFIPALQKFCATVNSPFLVLDRYPHTADDAAAFVAAFGNPKLVVEIACETEYLVEEFQEANEDAEVDPEELQAKFEEDKQVRATMLKGIEEACPGCVMSLSQATVKPEEMAEQIRKRLLPQVYVLASAGSFTEFVADSICTKGKYTILDSTKLLSSGEHTPELEAQLTKALKTAVLPDALPAQLWKALFEEAFAKSANPMGTFIVTNFPTPCSVGSSPTIRDQFCMLESISVLRGIMQVTLSQAAFSQCCSESQDALAAYLVYDQSVKEQTVVQFSDSQICEARVEDATDAKAAAGAVAVKLLQYLS